MRIGSVEGVGVADLVVITSTWLFCSSESGDDSREEEEAVLSTEEEIEGGMAVTLEEEPEEVGEEIDLRRGCAEAGAKDEAGAGHGAGAGSKAGGVEWSEVADSTSMGPSAPKDS